MRLPDLLVELHLRPIRHGPNGPRRLPLARGPLDYRSRLGGAKSDCGGFGLGMVATLSQQMALNDGHFQICPGL